MGIFYRLLGLTALFDDVLGAIRVNYLIRGNWILFAILLLYAFAGASALGLPWPPFPLEIPIAYPLLQVSLASSALVLLILCWVRGDTIFRPGNVVPRGDGLRPSPALTPPEPIDLRIWGRSDRDLGHSVSIRDLPVRWNVHDTGSISLETSIEQVGMTLADNSGSWSLAVHREALSDRTEGRLYFGVSARPALRLRLPGRRKAAILCVGNAAQLMALDRMIDGLLTESVAKEAAFFRAQPEANPSRPSPAQPPDAPGRREKPAGEVPWNDLIDFSS